MILKTGFGIGDLLFGMRRNEVEAAYGPASRRYQDEDGDDIWLYDQHKLRLTFYKEEDYRFGYLISASPQLSVDGLQPIGRRAKEVIASLTEKGYTKWTSEIIDSCENFVNEAQWLILQTEFGDVTKVESGAFIDEKNDVFLWRTK